MALTVGSNRGSRRGLNGARRARTAVVAVYGSDTHTFTVPAGGLYEFAGWSPGVYDGISTGAFALKRKRLGKGQTVAIQVGMPNAFNGGGSNTPTVFTFPDGTVVNIPTGDIFGAVAGTPTGGDVNLPGVAAGDAPSYGTYVGAPYGASQYARAPGGTAPNTPGRGGGGLAIVSKVD